MQVSWPLSCRCAFTWSPRLARWFHLSCPAPLVWSPGLVRPPLADLRGRGLGLGAHLAASPFSVSPGVPSLPELLAPPVNQARPHPRSSLTASYPQPQARVSTVGHLKHHGSPAEFLTSPSQHCGLGNSGGKPRNPPCLLRFPHTCLHPSIESSCLNFPKSRQLSNPSLLAPPKPTCGLPSRHTEKAGPRGSQRCSPAYLCTPICHHTLLPSTVAALTSSSCLKLLLGAEPPYPRVPSFLPSNLWAPLLSLRPLLTAFQGFPRPGAEIAHLSTPTAPSPLISLHLSS